MEKPKFLFLFNPKTGLFYSHGKAIDLTTVEEFVEAGLMVPVGEGEEKILAKPDDAEYVLGEGVVMAEE